MKLARLRHILAVFAAHGFDDMLSRSGISRFLPRYPKPPQTEGERFGQTARNLRLALEELGPTFIKLGQFMSSRPDVFPIEYLDELQKLQDRVPPVPADQAMATLAAEMPRPPEELFASVSSTPKASASLAQIHTARLKGGAEIVLKIQRPGVRQLIELDINLMYSVANLLDKYSKWAEAFSFTSFVKEFQRVIIAELDFMKEGENIERLAKNLKYFDHIRLPEVYWPYSTDKVLALEKIEGARLDDYKLSERLITRRHLAEEILEAYLKQIIEDGFFHADPHLGNVLFEPEGSVALIDLGIVGNLDSDMKFQVGQMLLSFANQEADKVTAVMMRVGDPVNTVDLKALELAVREVVNKYHFMKAGDLSLGRALVDLARVATAHKLRMPHNFNLLGKTLFYVDVLIKKLAPELDYFDFVKRSTQRVFANLWQSQFNLGRLTESALEVNRLVLDSPNRLNLILDKLVRDEFTIRFEHEHLGGMIKTFHQSANRLSFAVVVAAIIVGSALIIRVPVGQTFRGIPVLALSGFLIAGLLGLYLLIRILRTEKL
jgi:ubiquinone biosynthesis protein